MPRATKTPTISRRDALKATAGAGMIAVMPTTKLVAAEADPVFAVIEAHRRAAAAYSAVVAHANALEETLDPERRKSKFAAWGEYIVETDDPNWITAERKMMEASHAQDHIAMTLAETAPTTLAGAVALLDYSREYSANGDTWPEVDDRHDGSWTATMHATLADALRRIEQPASA